MLASNDENWGPRPLRMLKCWETLPGYNNFVHNRWQSFQLEGSGGYVLKEKLKLLKLALKEWHQTHLQNLPSRISLLKEEIAMLDLKGESYALSGDDIADLHGLSEDLFSLSRIHSSISWQQSIIQWLREGDANSKFFHGIMSNRRRRNSIPSFFVNGVQIEGVQNVRNAVFSHFSSHFKNRHEQRPSMEGLNFRKLSGREEAALLKPFSIEEVRAAVWECDNFKCPGPDRVNLGFIKDFWDILKVGALYIGVSSEW